ncbi:MAG: LapA family protein [Sneathiella sp.]
MKIFSWAFLAILGVAIVILSMGNKGDVSFSFFPLPFEMEVPLFALILAGGFLGVLLGAVRTGITTAKARGENRQGRREIAKLQGEVTRLTHALDAAKAQDARGSTNTPALSDQSKSKAA